MIIAISGKMGSGKSTLSDSIEKELEGVYRLKFAKVIYEMHDSILNILSKYYEAPKLDKRLLQLLGTEWGREMDNDIWVSCFKTEAARHQMVLCDDLRFKNEFTGLGDAIKIRLECSEEVRKARCSQWRENSTHQSEIDLDDWVSQFDLVIDTEFTTVEQAAQIAMEFINERISASTRVSTGSEAISRGSEESVENPL